MEYSDDESFVLSQVSTKNYCDIPSSQYGEDVVAGCSSGSVSLENIGVNFDVCGDMLYDGSTQVEQGACADIQIENISSDEDVDNM